MNDDNDSLINSNVGENVNKFDFFADVNYANELLKWANKRRSDPKNCDIKIKVKENTLIPCHKFVLGSASSNLEEILDSNENKDIVEMTNIDFNTMQSLLNFMYTGTINISSSNAEDVFVAAAFLKMNFVENSALDVLESTIDIKNCIKLFSLATQDSYKCSELKSKIFKFITRNFDKLWHTKEFLDLSEQQLVMCLSSDEIRFEMDEKMIFLAAQRWCEKRTDQNYDLNSVIETIRFQKLDPYFLESCCELFPVLKLSAKALELISEAKIAHMNSDLMVVSSPDVIILNEPCVNDSEADLVLCISDDDDDNNPSQQDIKQESVVTPDGLSENLPTDDVPNSETSSSSQKYDFRHRLKEKSSSLQCPVKWCRFLARNEKELELHYKSHPAMRSRKLAGN